MINVAENYAMIMPAYEAEYNEDFGVARRELNFRKFYAKILAMDNNVGKWLNDKIKVVGGKSPTFFKKGEIVAALTETERKEMRRISRELRKEANDNGNSGVCPIPKG